MSILNGSESSSGSFLICVMLNCDRRTNAILNCTGGYVPSGSLAYLPVSGLTFVYWTTSATTPTSPSLSSALQQNCQSASLVIGVRQRTRSLWTLPSSPGVSTKCPLELCSAIQSFGTKENRTASPFFSGRHWSS